MKTAETGRCLKQLTGNEVLFARRKQLKNPQRPVYWKRHDSCAGYLIFEQDLTSFYETGELNLAVDYRGKCFEWEMEFGFHIIKSFPMWQRSLRDTFTNWTKPDRMMKRKIPVTNPQHQTYTVKNASVCMGEK